MTLKAIRDFLSQFFEVRHAPDFLDGAIEPRRLRVIHSHVCVLCKEEFFSEFGYLSHDCFRTGRDQRIM